MQNRLTGVYLVVAYLIKFESSHKHNHFPTIAIYNTFGISYTRKHSPSIRLLSPKPSPRRQLLIHLHRMFPQTLVPLHRTPHQESPTPPKRTQPTLPLPPSPRQPKTRTNHKPHPAHKIPKPNMPPQCPKSRNIPSPLRLNHEQETGENEASATDDLGCPEEEG